MRRISAVFALATLSLLAADNPPAATPASGDKPEPPAVTFRSDVSLARADAQVVDQDNRPIRGLRAEDFVLRESGKQREIRNFQNEAMPVDVILLMDVSRSMEPHVQRMASASHEGRLTTESGYAAVLDLHSANSLLRRRGRSRVLRPSQNACSIDCVIYEISCILP